MFTLNPKAVITDRLHDLLIGDQLNERALTTGLRDVFTGHIEEWKGFNQELRRFYHSAEMQQAFDKTQDVYIDWDPQLGFTAGCPTNVLQSTRKVSDESTLSEKFTENVLYRVESVAKTLANSGGMDGFLRSDFDHGSPFSVNVKDRTKEPDVIFKIPAGGKGRKVRFIGELKYSETCDMAQKWGDKTSQERNSMRHIFGQVARDMWNYRVRYGFVSTYKETIFLKIHTPKFGPATLQYSQRILHTESVLMNEQGRMTQPSMRLGVLFLLHKASSGKSSDWSLNGTEIVAERWTASKPNTDLGPLGSDAATPRTPLASPLPQDAPRIARDNDEANGPLLNTAVSKVRVAFESNADDVTPSRMNPDTQKPMPSRLSEATPLTSSTGYDEICNARRRLWQDSGRHESSINVPRPEDPSRETSVASSPAAFGTSRQTTANRVRSKFKEIMDQLTSISSPSKVPKPSHPRRAAFNPLNSRPSSTVGTVGSSNSQMSTRATGSSNTAIPVDISLQNRLTGLSVTDAARGGTGNPFTSASGAATTQGAPASGSGSRAIVTTLSNAAPEGGPTAAPTAGPVLRSRTRAVKSKLPRKSDEKQH